MITRIWVLEINRAKIEACMETKSWLLDADEELQTVVFGEDRVWVYCVSGDGRVRVLDEEGNPLSASDYKAFVRDSINLKMYALLCVDAGRVAWVMRSDDPKDFMKIKHRVREGRLELYE